MRAVSAGIATWEPLLGTPVMVVFLAIWLAGMIAVPLVARRGVGYRSRAISQGVVVQVLLVVVVLFNGWPWQAALRAVVLVPLLGWVAEFIGTRTGLPFGRYHYTDVMQPQIHRVPAAIPAAWLMMMPPSWAIAEVAVPGSSWWLGAVVAGAAFTAWDIYLDPHLVNWRFWEWDDHGRFYLGIPLTNFLGWFLWATVITAAVQPPSLEGTPLWLVYVLTWLFQFGGHLVFWKLRVSAAAGFAAMGALIVPALVNLSSLV